MQKENTVVHTCNTQFVLYIGTDVQTVSVFLVFDLFSDLLQIGFCLTANIYFNEQMLHKHASEEVLI